MTALLVRLRARLAALRAYLHDYEWSALLGYLGTALLTLRADEAFTTALTPRWRVALILAAALLAALGKPLVKRGAASADKSTPATSATGDGPRAVE